MQEANQSKKKGRKSTRPTRVTEETLPKQVRFTRLLSLLIKYSMNFLLAHSNERTPFKIRNGDGFFFLYQLHLLLL